MPDPYAESRRWLEHIEPQGRAAASGDGMALKISEAISAKRQADALERIANAFDGQSATGNMLYWLENIASNLHGGR